MLRNTLTCFVVLVTFVFIIVETSTDEDKEVNVNHDDNKEEVIISNEQPEPNTSIHFEKGVNDSAEADINKSEDSKLKTKDVYNNDIAKNKKDNAENGTPKSHKDPRELLKKFKENRKPLWKMDDKSDKRQEPGFDLTAEEKKKFKIWNGGVIPYYIDVISFSDKVLRDKIRNYLQMVNSAAGLKFIELPVPPSDDNERWVFFMNRRSLLGCADHTVRNFTTQGVQQVVLGYDCIQTRGEMAEAVMSIAGVPAQHNAPDRDKFIQVNMENIQPDKKYLFEKLTDDQWLFHNLEYDFNSITHYDIFKYSANGRPTIQLKDESIDLGHAKELSPNDLLKIKMLYNYMTRSLRLKSRECERLFKPRNTFERFVPHEIYEKPRKKPSRYLGKVQALSHKSHLDRLVNRAEKNKREKKRIEENAMKNKNKKEIIQKLVDQDKSWEPRKPLKPGYKIYKTEALSLLSDYHSN